jgi:iron complex transport system ATP-binding protein
LQRANAALAGLGIGHLTERPLVQMSSGEAKRALIARALVHQPDTLLFDEPSSALDIAAQLQLRETMRELARSGLAILLVTHHVSEIIPEIDRVILLRDGQILMDGSKHEVLVEKNLSKLFGVDVRIHPHEGAFHIY